MTGDQEKAVTEALAAGLSERETAKRCGVSPAAVHRLRVKLADTEPGDEGTPGTPVAPGTAEAAAAISELREESELAGLTRIRDEITSALVTQQARAEASAAAVQDLERQQTDRLAAGMDASALRPRLRDARDDLAEWARSIALLRQRLEETDSRIASVRARGELAQLRAELDEAMAARAEVYARSGDRQRAAVLAVRAAAEDFAAVFADETAATERVARAASAAAQLAVNAGQTVPAVPEPVVTRLSLQGGTGPELALTQAAYAAQRGDLAAVAAGLGQANGWLPAGPPSEEEQAEYRRITEERAKQLAELKAKQELGPGGSPAGETTDLWNGQPVPVHAYQPHPLDVFRAPGSPGNYGPGYRTGW